MNHVYRVVWSAALGTFQVVSELTRGHGGRSGGTGRKRARPRAATGAKALAAAAALVASGQAASLTVYLNGIALAVPYTDSNLTITSTSLDVVGPLSYGTSGANLIVEGALGTLTNNGTIAGRFVSAGLLNEGTISMFYNYGTFTGAGGRAGIENSANARIGFLWNVNGTISTIQNDAQGLIGGSGMAGAMTNLSSIGVVANSGLISGATGGINNFNFIGTISNAGTITGGVGINNSNSITSIDNSALSARIEGISVGIYNRSGSIGTITNSGTITGVNAAIDNRSGSIGVLNNNTQGAVIGGAFANTGVYNTGTIGTVTNSGSIVGAIYGVYNDDTGKIGSIGNSGDIVGTGGLGADFGIFNTGSIGVVSNSGSITGSIGIVNYKLSASGGTLGQLINSQGGTINSVLNAGLIGGSLATAAIVNSGGIGTLSSSGTINGDTNGVSVTGTGSITLLSNSGLIAGVNVAGIDNSGSIRWISNVGSITGATAGIVNGASGAATIGRLTNQGNGTIDSINNASAGVIGGVNTATGLANHGSIGAIVNSGVISGTVAGISNDDTLVSATIGTFTNNAGASISAVYNGQNAVIGSAVGAAFTNNGTIDTLTNLGSMGLLTIGTSGTLGTLSNSGAMHAMTTALVNDGTIASLGNSGLISSSNSHAIDNSGYIGTLTNTGAIVSGGSANHDGIRNGATTAATIGQLINEASGSISSVNNGTYGVLGAGALTGLENAGTLGTLTNGGTILGSAFGVYNNGSSSAGLAQIGAIDNHGSISSVSNGVYGVIGASASTALVNYGTIGKLTNDGLITGTAGVMNTIGGTLHSLANGGTIAGMALGVANVGTLDTLTNTGNITGGAMGVGNGGTLGSLVNVGTISGGAVALGTFAGAIVNLQGAIGTITNSGVIEGNIVNVATSALTINGGTGTIFGTLTGLGNTIGTILNASSALMFASGNLLLNDNIDMGPMYAVHNSAAVLEVDQPVTISGSYYQGAGATLQIGVASGATAAGAISDTGYGRLVVSGTSTIASGSNVTLKSNGYAFAAGQRYVVVDTAGAANYNEGALHYSISGGSSSLGVTGTVVANGANRDLVLLVGDGSSGAGSGGSGGSDPGGTGGTGGTGSGSGDSGTGGSGSSGSGSGDSGSGSSGSGSGNSGSGGTSPGKVTHASVPNAIASLGGLFAYSGIANAQLLNLYNASLGAVASGSTPGANRIGLQLGPAQIARAAMASTFDAMSILNAHVNALRVAQADGATGLATGDSFSQVNLWGQAFGGHASQDARDDVDGYSANYGGLLIGADKALNDKWRVGGVFQYAHTAINNSDSTSGDSTGVNGYGLIGYASFTGSPWYVNMSGAAVLQRYDTERRVTMPGFDGVANGSFNGQQYVASVEGGWPLAVGSATLTPLASLTYSYLNQNSYTETGGNGAALHVDSSSASSVRSALGAKIEKAYDTSYGQIVPELRAAWVHEYNRTRQSTGASFAGDPTGATGFTTVGMTPVSNLADISLGLTLLRANNLSVTARYELQAGSGFISNTGILRLEQRF